MVWTKKEILSYRKYNPQSNWVRKLEEAERVLEVAAGKKKPEAVSADLQEKFDYGTENEINAIATFVAKLLPAFCPSGAVFEEGCYVLHSDGEIKLVVSPDGSVRHKSNENMIISGIEVKCPFPGKLFSTPVHYQLPHYYVTQILSEMHVLGVDNLYFLSYGKESMTIQSAKYDEELWNMINSEINSLDINKISTRTNPSITIIRQKLKQYCKTNVTFIAEIKSCVGLPCKHDDAIGKRIYHNALFSDIRYEPVSLSELTKCFIKCQRLVDDCHKLCAHRASEVLVFLLSDLDRTAQFESVHAYPIAYALRGYSMKAEAMRLMIHEVLKALVSRGLYTLAVCYDGEWASVAFKTGDGVPLTLLELQKNVYNEAKGRTKSNVLKEIFETCVIKVDDINDYMTIYRENNTLFVEMKFESKPFSTSRHIAALIKNLGLVKQGNNSTASFSGGALISPDMDDLLSTVDTDILEPESDICLLLDLQDTDITSENTILSNLTLPDRDFTEIIIGYNDVDESVLNRDIISTEPEPDIIPEQECDDLIFQINMFHSLQNDAKCGSKWENKQFEDFKALMQDKSLLSAAMTRVEIEICLCSIQTLLSQSGIKVCKSWTKSKISDILHKACTTSSSEFSNLYKVDKVKKSRRFPPKLQVLCKRSIQNLPKSILNAVIAERNFRQNVESWRMDGPFVPSTYVTGVGNIVWFSCPEYNSFTEGYIFSFLDIHHLITNCRIKVCKDGFPDRKVYKQAWIDVARSNKTNLKISHVEDLVDKQSDAIARQTFSEDVELLMHRLGHLNEAYFCKIIREFYEAEDNPGIGVFERCSRRLALRDWLFDGVNLMEFPPHGSHIRGVPRVMFQGFVTNIERRLQLFPFLKSGKYNVRSLGSLEIENMFGEFQDLDPKGSGVIKTEEIPVALEAACQLLRTRLKTERKFYMAVSRAKVYPTVDLMEEGSDSLNPGTDVFFQNHLKIDNILPREHPFDLAERSKRKPKRKHANIASVDEAARGVAPVRQFHKCDESKILAHKREGIQL